MEFINGVAAAAERCGHYPEWSNIGDRVEIILTTHSVQGVSDRDLKLAARIDALALDDFPSRTICGLSGSDAE